ncbi:MAG TPA: hypothetical protein VFF30_18210 [Nitrososphaerales archaeon]|nr:hypothetical protein [Nitrososphaerales archaeon]
MADWKSFVAVLMGLVILVADVAWLIIGRSYTYTPWLILGAVIFVATAVWLAIDGAFVREIRPRAKSYQVDSPRESQAETKRG